MKSIGILGGTFDPIHYGHIYLAQQARDEIGLSKVIFIPAKMQPFKLDQLIADGNDRLQMIMLAIEGMEKFEVSNLEFLLPDISYTINTLRAIKEMETPDTEIYFIIGTDAFLKINTWKHADELLRDYAYIVGTRPGFMEEELENCIEYNREVYNTKIERINNKRLFISSTEIKEKISKGERLDAFVPTAVERFIYDKGLYQ